ncbi:MGMT family protein [Solirubrobacter taibaiensis]|nr:MGMT family protein [Solirubrobacter taibaiensis]
MLRFETAIGACGISWSPTGLTRVSILGGGTSGEEPPEFVREAVAGIVALLEGEPRDLREVPLDLTGVEAFAAGVYAQARLVGPGELCTYGDLARAVGSPGGAQAVGRAMGSNPFPIVVPCHRVLSSTGALHGFSAPGGIATKRRMLEIERAPGFTQQTLFA